MFSFLNSLRWRLQAWHALILLLVIVGFGYVIFREIVRSNRERVVDELLGASRILEGSLRSIPRPMLDSLAQDLGQRKGPWIPPLGPPGRERQEPPSPLRGGPSMRDGPRDGAREGKVRGDVRPPLEDRSRPPIRMPWDGEMDRLIESMSQEEWEARISLPRALPEPMGRRDSSVYFVIWREDGSVLRESAVPDPRPSVPSNVEEQFHRNRYLTTIRGDLQEVFIRAPRQTIVCVGRSVADEQNHVRRLTLILVSAGATIFAIGMLGGSWLSRRAIAPIQKMSQLADEIQSNTLSRRIDIHGFDSEFARLGAVLNSMFDRLHDAFQQQRRFVADASHELRTPLSVIMTSTELALAKERSPDEYKFQLETCQRSANRMHQLVESLLMLARLDGKQTSEAPSLFDLAGLTQENLDWLGTLASERQIQFVADLQTCMVSGHHNLLNQLITNLLMNAIQYNKVGGTVKIEVRPEADGRVLIISDDGIGIPENDLQHLFDRFYRVDQARSRNTGGNGLGLAICQRIVEIHRGTIEVKSRVAEGTRFIIRFPIPEDGLPH
jgi:two-component system, OmpR family, sensor kinase